MAIFHFSLLHLDEPQTLEVNMHGRSFPLNPHTTDTRNSFYQNHPVLSRLSASKSLEYSHFAEIPDDHLHGPGPRWLRVVRPTLLDAHLPEVVLMSQIIPPDRLQAFYNSPMWKERYTRRYGRHATRALLDAAKQYAVHFNGRLHALGITPPVSVDDSQIEMLLATQELVDSLSTAAALVAHHPNLATTLPNTAAYILNTHILPDPAVNPDQYNAMQVLSDQIANTSSWSPVINCTDKNGNLITAGYNLGTFKEGQQLQTYSLADNVSSASAPATAGPQTTTSDDLQLQNQLWSPTPGTSALQSANVTAKAVATSLTTNYPQFKWTVPYQTYTDGIKMPNGSLSVDGQNNFSIDVYNIYSRTLYVAYELFDANGNSLGPRQLLGSITAVDNLLGIPLPYSPTNEAFNIGQASEIKIYFGSMGRINWDQVTWDDGNVTTRGALLTGAWQYGVPMLFVISGKVITSTKVMNKIVNNKALVKIALEILNTIVGTGVDSIGSGSSFSSVVLAFANAALTFIAQKGMESFGEWIIEQVGEGELESSFGPVGWIFKLVAAGLDFEQIAITTGEVLASDALTIADIKRAIDVSLTLHPDPAHGEAGNPKTAVWPSVATSYVATLQCQSGTNFVLTGAMPSTTSNTPIPLLFANVPAGGNIRIFVGLYSANGWLAGSWQNNWIPAVSNQGTTLALGDENIKENLVPLGIDTQYVYKEKIAYANSEFSWENGTIPATTLTSLDCNNGLCELNDITVNNSAFQVGYAWRAANQHLHPDSPTAPISEEQLYVLQNLSVLAQPSSRLITTQIGLTQKPGIAYAESINTQNVIDETNFILDPRNGTMNLRKVTLNNSSTDFGLGDPDLLSWGAFPLDNLDALVVHPSNAVLACSFSNHKLMILPLPTAPITDKLAPQAQLVSGEGVREGLLKGPKALAVAPDGRILILESLNNRVQAFDIQGNAVPCFTPNPYVFTLNTADVATALDAGTVPDIFINSLVNAGENYVGPLPDNSFIAELDGGKFQSQNDPLILALSTLGINLAYDPEDMSDPTQSAQIQVVQAGQSWIITDPRQQAWPILNQSSLLNVYKRPVLPVIKVQSSGNQWLITDNLLGNSWLLQVSSDKPDVVEIFDCFTYFPLQTGPNGDNLNYLDMAVEAQGYMYVLSYQNDGSATTDYLLDLYAPDGTFLVRSPDPSKTTNPQNIVAGKITVDIWRDLYALTYETLNGPNGVTQPGLAHWMPTPPLFSLPLTEQPNFNAQNISAIQADFAAHGITLSNQAFILIENLDGYWQVKDGETIYHVYRSGNALQVYSVPA